MQLIEEIQKLKKKRNAVLLVHNYQPGQIQDIADFLGDSLELSRQAAKTDAEVIVFCGVRFMAETAAILSPDKTVLLPDKAAGCPMADMITAKQLRQLKAEHPDALVVCYVNSSAEVKAESDYCCTSANAVEVIRSLPADKRIIFVPDKHLGHFAMKKTGRDMILWPGYCPTHVSITAEDIRQAKRRYPDAVCIAHPECPAQVLECVDEALSTSQMLRYASNNPAREFIVATENGIIYTLQKQNPEKKFYEATPRAICPNMKRISEDIRIKAKRALDRMLDILPSK